MSKRQHNWWDRCLVIADEARTRVRLGLRASGACRWNSPALQMSDLEPRILLSATPIDLGSLPGSVPAAMVVQVESAVPESESASAELVVAQHPAGEIIIIDSAAPQLQQLLDDLSRSGRSADVFILEADRNGLDQITQVLDSRTDIESIHIVSHAEAGAVKLGDLWLSEANLGGYAGQIATWQSSLTIDADILFYGCDLADSASGRTLIESISAISGADVAASTDDTGHSDFGGNWDLEYRVGAIESGIPFSQDIQHNWTGKLSTITVDTFADVISGADGLTSLREAILQVNAGAGGETILLAAGTYTLSISGVGDNLAVTGDLDILTAVTIVGDSAASTIIDGNGIDRVFDVYPGFGGGVTFSGMTIQGGNVAMGNGGGINVNGGADVTVADTWITNNTAENGGGLHTVSALVVKRSTVSGNTASNDGGGIFVTGGGGTLDLTNVTVSGNTAASGGAIRTSNTISVTNSTIAFNTGTTSIGGIHTSGTGNAVLKNTILANNTGGNADSSLTSAGYNIDSDGTANISYTGDLSGTIPEPLDPLLGLLQDNGGFTPTHAITVASPAYNAGTTTGAPVTDQRGETRDASVDMGAFEVTLNGSMVVTAAADTYIDNIAAGLNYGSSTSLVVDQSGGGIGNRRTLLRFDFGSIPVGATINGASLNMQATGQTGSGFDVKIWELTQSWEEGLENGTADVANWTDRDSINSWTAAGGDYDPTIVATLNASATGQHTWDVTSLVQAWHTGSKVNNGLIIGNDNTGTSTFTYDSREGATPPELEIYYTVLNDPPTDIVPNFFSINENVDTTGGISVGTLVASDPDPGETFTWEVVGGTDQSKFTTSGNQLMLDDGTLDFETQSSYSVAVRVTDSAMNTYDETLIVNVNDINEAPTVSTTAGFLNFTENDLATPIDSGLIITKPDGANIISGQVTIAAGYVSGQDTLTFTNQLGITGAWNTGTGILTLTGNASAADYQTALRTVSYVNGSEAPDEATRSISFQVHDGIAFGSDSRFVNVSAVNDMPVLSNLAGDSLNYTAGVGAETIEQGSDVTVGDLDSTNFDNGNLTVSIVAGGDNAEDVLSIRDQGISAGQIGFDGTNVRFGGTLIGVASGGTSGTPLVVLLNSDSTTIATAALIRNISYENLDAVTPTTGARTVRFVVDDGDGDTSLHHDATVTVLAANIAPTDISPNSLPLDENTDTTGGYSLGTLAASDPDMGETFNWSIQPGGDENVFSIVVGTGQLTLDDGLLDFESKSSYSVNVRVTDSAGNTYDETLTVTINDLNDNPPDVDPSQSFDISEFAANGSSLGTVTAADADTSTTFSNWTITSGNGQGIFEIDSNTGELTVFNNTNLNFETTAGYTLGITVSDGTNTSVAQTIEINVVDENDAPSDITLDSSNVNENADGAVIGNLSVFDADAADTHNLIVDDLRFEIAGTQLKLKAGQTLDRETEPTVNLTITATDQAGAGLAYNKAFVITVDNVNEIATDITLSSTNVPELTDGAVVGNVDVVDPDTGDTHTWSVDDIRFEIAAGKLKLKTGQTLDRITDPTVNLTLTATDQAGTGLAYNEAFVITVDDVNQAPTDITLGNTSVNENADGAIIGNLGVVDPDSGDSHTWSVDDTRFEIVAGQLKLKAGQTLDKESEPTVNLAITATDQAGTGLAYNEAFVITVSDVNEIATDITLDNTNVNENAGGAIIGNLGVVDPDSGDTHTWSVDDTRFEIVAGQLKLKTGQTLDKESEPTVNLAITATDQAGTGLAYNEAFVITVSDVNEIATDITLDNTNVNENADSAIIGNLGVVDPDSGDSHTWSVDDTRFEIVAGQLKLKTGQTLDKETEPTVNLTITATDQAGTGLAYNEAFVITVSDVNEIATDITLDNTNVNENADGAIIGNLGVVDPDTGDTHTWSVDDTRFEIVAGQLKLKTGQTLDKETEPTVNLAITATDQAGTGLAYNEAFVITVSDVNEIATDITLDNTSINENAGGAIIGNLGVVDPDTGDTHTWSVDDTRFEIVAGQLKLKAGEALDKESEPTVNLAITATDQAGTGLAYNEAFVITVSDVNEIATDITLDNTNVNENADGAIIGNLGVVDPDSG